MNCLYCLEDIDNGRNFFEYFFVDDVLCGNCRKQLQSMNKTVILENNLIYVFYLYDDFFEKVIKQYKESEDTALRQLFFKGLKWIKKQYPNLKIVIPPSCKKKFHGLKYLLQDFEVIEPFIKTKNIKQSQQNSENRHKIKSYIQLIQDVKEEKVILFDDVITSGNTILHCKQLLEQQNIEVICIVLSIHHMCGYKIASRS